MNPYLNAVRGMNDISRAHAFHWWHGHAARYQAFVIRLLVQQALENALTMRVIVPIIVESVRRHASAKE